MKIRYLQEYKDLLSKEEIEHAEMVGERWANKWKAELSPNARTKIILEFENRIAPQLRIKFNPSMDMLATEVFEKGIGRKR